MISVSFKIKADGDEGWGWILAGGIFEIVFAFILLSNPLLTATTLPFVLGFP